MNMRIIGSGNKINIVKIILNKEVFSKTLMIHKQTMIRKIHGNMHNNVNINISHCHFELSFQVRIHFAKERLIVAHHHVVINPECEIEPRSLGRVKNTMIGRILNESILL